MILVRKADSLHYDTHLTITWSLETRWTAEFTLRGQRLHCGWGGGRQPWKTLSQNTTCRSEHENCPAVCWYFVCGVLSRNESTALCTFPLLTDNLLGMAELFLHGLAAKAQQNAEQENTALRHSWSGMHHTRARQESIKDTFKLTHLTMLYKPHGTSDFSGRLTMKTLLVESGDGKKLLIVKYTKQLCFLTASWTEDNPWLIQSLFVCDTHRSCGQWVSDIRG